MLWGALGSLGRIVEAQTDFLFLFERLPGRSGPPVVRLFDTFGSNGVENLTRLPRADFVPGK